MFVVIKICPLTFVEVYMLPRTITARECDMTDLMRSGFGQLKGETIHLPIEFNFTPNSHDGDAGNLRSIVRKFINLS